MKNKIAVFIATWFYTGLIPPFILNGMAGTYGSFFSIPLCYFALWLAKNGYHLIYLIIILIIFLVGLWSVPRAEVTLGPKRDWRGKTKDRDQNQIVIDETLGMLITCWLISITGFDSYWWTLFIAFALFRFFDIVKVPPTNFFDRMKNAYGVMLDDFVAGVYASLILFVLVLVFNI